MIRFLNGRVSLYQTFSHFSDAELDEGVAEIRRNHAESTRDHGGSSRPQVTIGDRLVLISAEVGEAVGSLKQ